MSIETDNNGQEKHTRLLRDSILGFLIALPFTIYVICVCWPSLCYFLLVIMFSGDDKILSRLAFDSAHALGKQGNVFFINMGAKWPSRSVLEYTISYSIAEYLAVHGCTEEIWEIIVEAAKRPETSLRHSNSDHSNDMESVEGYIFDGPWHFKPNTGTSTRRPFFSEDKIRWANVNLFNRPAEYGLAKHRNRVVNYENPPPLKKCP